MIKCTKQENVELSVAEAKYHHLKRNALLNVMLGAFFLYKPFAAFTDYLGLSSETASTVIGFICIPLIIYVTYMLVSIWIENAHIERLEQDNDLEDEFITYVKKMSREITLYSIVIIAGVVNFLPYTASVLINTHFPKIVVGLYFVICGASRLYLLREDNE